MRQTLLAHMLAISAAVGSSFVTPTSNTIPGGPVAPSGTGGPCPNTGGVDIGPNQTGSGTYAYAATTGPVYASYLGAEACYTDVLRVGGVDVFNNHTTPVGARAYLGDFQAGEKIDLSVYVVELNTVFQPGPGSANPDGYVHFDFRAFGGDLRFGVEDLWRGGHEGTGDFDDLVGLLTNATDRPTSPVPEPNTLVLVGLALCAITHVVRRRV